MSQKSSEDSVILQAMQDELTRNYQNLQLGQFKQPYFLEYTFGRVANFEVVGSLGAVLNSYQSQQTSSGAVRLLLGNLHRTSDFLYNGVGYPVRMPSETSYDEIRRCYWLATDVAYKNSIQNYVSKMAFLQSNPKSEEEEQLDDFSKVEVRDNLIESLELDTFDKMMWEKRIERLSGIFKEYPKLFNSSVGVSGLRGVVYKYTSEDVRLQMPIGYVVLFASASVLGDDGVSISDSWSVSSFSFDELFSEEELEKQIRSFADGLLKLSAATPIDEFYSGPILFEDRACSNIFSGNLLAPGRLITLRKPENGKEIMTLDNRMGRKIIDGRLTVTNEPGLKSYNGKILWGYYEVDADGVVPSNGQVLVENGLLRSQLNGRVPTIKAPYSTGSSRFVLPANTINSLTAPGTIHISVKNGLKAEKMKKALLKAAKEEGLDYAYIVKKMAGQASLVYQVDVKTGKETQVRVGNFSSLDLVKIKRIHEISSKENVMNFLYENAVPASLIYPSSILVDDVEINVPNLKKEQEDALVYPLQRKK